MGTWAPGPWVPRALGPFYGPRVQGPWSLLGRSLVPFRVVPGPLRLGLGLVWPLVPTGPRSQRQLWTLGPGPLGPLGPWSLLWSRSQGARSLLGLGFWV